MLSIKKMNLDVKLFTERSTDKMLPLSACLSGTLAVKNVSLDLCQVMFEVCPHTNTHTQRCTSQIWGTCILTSVGLF